MLGSLKRFLRNHWQKLLFGTVSIQAVLLGVRYMTNRLRAIHSEQTRLVVTRLKKKQHFEQLEEDIISVFKSMIPIMKETLDSQLNPWKMMGELHHGISPAQKVAVWKKVTEHAFSRVIAIAYGLPMLLLVLRIQMSILGGKLFKAFDTVPNPSINLEEAMLQNDELAIDKELQSLYLQIPAQFCSEGFKDLCNEVHEKCQNSLKDLTLKQRINAVDLEQIFKADGSYFHSCHFSHPSKYVYDSWLKSENVCGTYKKLIEETADILNSEDAIGILKQFGISGINFYIDKIFENLVQLSGADTSRDSSEVTFPVVSVVNVMNKIIMGDIITEADGWINFLFTSENVKTLGANVFESFSSEETNNFTS